MESHVLLQAGQSSEAAACVLMSQLLSKEGGGGGECHILITSDRWCQRTVCIWFPSDSTEWPVE